MTKYYVDAQGNYLGGFDGYQPWGIVIIEQDENGDDVQVITTPDYVYPEIPQGALEVPFPPDHGLDLWVNGKWVKPVEAPEQIIARLEGALDRHLDAVANEYRYESIRTMVTYATSEHPDFGKEGRAAVKFRDAVYAHGIKALQDVQAGLRPIPTESELIAELPLITEFFPAA